MALRPILHYPDPKLREIADPVTDFGPELQSLVDDMFETMYEDRGVGLAATQLGIKKQILVMDVSRNNKQPMCLINPEIADSRGEMMSEEGCLSFPGLYVKVPRAKWVHIKAKDRHGEDVEIKTEEFLGICIQHEMDHLIGKVLIDHLSPLKRERALKKLEKVRRGTL